MQFGGPFLWKNEEIIALLRLLVMEDGYAAEEGSADQVIAHPRSACARWLVDAAL